MMYGIVEQTNGPDGTNNAHKTLPASVGGEPACPRTGVSRVADASAPRSDFYGAPEHRCRRSLHACGHDARIPAANAPAPAESRDRRGPTSQPWRTAGGVHSSVQSRSRVRLSPTTPARKNAPVSDRPPTAPLVPRGAHIGYKYSHRLMSASPAPGPNPSPPGVFAAELVVERLDAEVDGRTLRPVFTYIPWP